MSRKSIICQEDITATFLRVWTIRHIENPARFFRSRPDTSLLKMTNRQHIKELLSRGMPKEEVKEHMENDMAEQNDTIYTMYITQHLPSLDNIKTTEVNENHVKKYYQDLTIELQKKDEWTEKYLEQIVWLSSLDN